MKKMMLRNYFQSVFIDTFFMDMSNRVVYGSQMRTAGAETDFQNKTHSALQAMMKDLLIRVTWQSHTG